MSHDRGCSCGRESYEYQDCTLRSCHNRKPKMYAVIETHEEYVPGDERSKTNPGHGYPEHYSTYESFKIFKDEESLKQALLTYSKYKNVQVFKIEPIKYTVETQVIFK